MRFSALLACGLLSISAAIVWAADLSVEIKGTHLCCGACNKAAIKAVQDSGSRASISAKTIFITAADEAAAQKAVDALAEAGFRGVSNNDKVKSPEAKDVPAGKVKKLELTGIHNCCGQCNNAIKGALKKVEGVTGDNAKSGSRDLTVEGDFDAAAAVKALFDAGYHVSVKK
jgi:mercuric ion binding protein